MSADFVPSGPIEEIAARLERLPTTRFTWRIVTLGSLAFVIESLSIGAMGVVLPILKGAWALSSGMIGLLAVASTIGIIVGLIPAGRLADRYGRKAVLFWGIIEYSVLTMLAALSPNYRWLLVIRFLSGLGMGAVFPMPYSIISEFVASNRRTLFNGIMDSALSAGYFLAPLFGLAILPRLAPDLSWRIFFLTSGIPLIFAFLIRRYLPESPRWLVRSGHQERAFSVMTNIEQEVSHRLGQPLPPPRPKPVLVSAAPRDYNLLSPWRRTHLRRTVVLASAAIGTFFMFYIVMTYLPLIFSRQGFVFAQSLWFTAIITAAAIPGKLLNGWLGESLGRKWMYVLFMVIAGAGALFFGIAHTASLMIFYGCVMSFFGTGTFPVLKIAYSEQYPTLIRTTGAATVETLGRLFGGVVGPYAFPALITAAGLGFSFDLVAVVAFLAVLIMLIFGQESKQQSLEALEAKLG